MSPLQRKLQAALHSGELDTTTDYVALLAQAEKLEILQHAEVQQLQEYRDILQDALAVDEFPYPGDESVAE